MSPPAKRLFRLLLMMICALVLLHVGAKILYRLEIIPLRIDDFFNLDRETNLPTWLSSIQLAVCGLFSLVIGLRGGVDSRPIEHRVFWIGVAGGLLLMSIDEFAQLHELLQRDEGGLGLRHHWIVYLLPVVAIYGAGSLYLAIRLLREFPVVLRSLILGGAIFLAGSVGVEALMLTVLVDTDWVNLPGVNSLIVIPEESLEMLGVSLALAGIFEYYITDRGGPTPGAES